jgi:uncharacterized protein (UPF0179 family)
MRQMKNLLLFFAISVLLSSCYEREYVRSPKPEQLLTPEQMVEILTDLQLEEARVVALREKNKAYNNSTAQYDQNIIDKYGISVKVLIENINYYQDQEEDMIDIYDEILAKLSRMQEDVKLKVEEEKKLEFLNDSIAKADSINLKKADSLKIAIDTTASEKPITTLKK